MSSYTMPDGFKVSLSVSLFEGKWVVDTEGVQTKGDTMREAVDSALERVLSEHLPRGLSDKAREVLMTIRNTAYLDAIIRAGYKEAKAERWAYEYIRHDLGILVDYETVCDIVSRYYKTV